MTARGTLGTRRDRNDKILAMIIFIGIIAFAVAVATWWWFSRAGGLDARLCPAGGPSGHTIILIDKTDPLPLVQERALRQLLSEVARRRANDFHASADAELPLRVGELLSIFVLGEDYKSTPDPIFERCNPGVGENASVWFSNPERLEKLYTSEFDDKLAAVQGDLTAKAASKWSPIMEMLQMVSINGFRHGAVNGPRKLIVVSDLLQNTPELSHFKSVPSFDEFKKTGYYGKLSTDLANVEVHLRYLMFSPPLQTRRLNKFWEDYFADQGATIKTVKPLQ